MGAAANCVTRDVFLTNPQGAGARFTTAAMALGAIGVPMRVRRDQFDADLRDCDASLSYFAGGNRPFEHGHTIQRSTKHPGNTGKRRRRRNRHRAKGASC